MRTKSFTEIAAILLTIISLCSFFPLNVNAAEYTVDEVNSLIDGIIGYKLSTEGAGSVQDWIYGSLTDNAGTLSEWYILSLSQYGSYDFSSYENSLRSYLLQHDESSATSREKYALALSAAGSSDRYMSDILDTSIGAQGIMSYIYGLHVLNNGYECPSYTTDDVIDHLLSSQYGDGGWALFGEYGDIDVTAMTMLALSPYYNSNNSVHEAVDRGISFLSERQQDNGGYQSFGTPNPESASQVLCAVSALGIDCVHDDRFIKNGNNVIDGIIDYRLSDGSFSHVSGGDSNESATVQALYSLIAYKRMHDGKSPLFVLDNRRSVADEPQHTDTPAVNHNGTSEQESDSPSAPSSDSSTTTASSTSVSTSAVSGYTTSIIISSSGTEVVFSVNETSSVLTTAATTTSYTKKTGTVITERSGRKTKALIIIGISAFLLGVLLFVLKKRNIKNYVFILICAGAASAFVLLTDIQSADEYYSGSISHKENAVGTVTMEIRCDTIAGKSDSEYIPEDGTILQVTDFEIEEGDTVFDILTEAAQTYGIQMENKGSSGSTHGMVYIAGINYIYEYDFGDLSGWVYHVNGITPSRNCGDYVLSDGDRIEWLYTCELGHDLNEVYEHE